MIVVIIVNYFASRLAARAVHSLMESRDAGNGEILDIWIVDNSESEHEAESLRHRLGHLCHIVVNRENLGFGEACNQVYRRVESPWVLLLNPDAYLAPGALTKMRRFLESDTRVGAVGPRVYWDEARKFLLPPSLVPSPWQDFLGRPKGHVGGSITWSSSLRYRARARRYWQATKPLAQRNLSGGHVLLRRTAVEKAGGLFDPRFFLYYEDTDLFVRLRKAGYRLYALPDALATHAFSGCAPDRFEWKNANMARSHRQFLAKHYDGDRLRAVLNRFGSADATGIWQPRIADLGELDSPPTFSVPPAWRKNWLMEWSPSPYFMPAAGCFGCGAEAAFPASAWPILLPGKSFLRLGPTERFWIRPRAWQWVRAGE
jgi:hypothetical protein